MAVKQKAKNKFGKIGVLMGGPSSEREISLKSGKAVYESLNQLGLDAVAIDIKTDDLKENARLIKSRKIDVAFVALHGRFGEDGQIQELLANLKVPYTGSGIMASRLAMDKVASRKIFQAHGLSVPKYTVEDKISYSINWRVHNNALSFPLVVKPSTHGSSVGLSIVESQEGLGEAVATAFGFDNKIIIEEYIKGREMTVGILDERALPVIEIIPKKRFFDYEAKYQSGMTDYIVPAQLEEDTAKKIQAAGLSAHKLLRCFGCSRVDIILSAGGIPFILEVNTIPGFTQTSLLPKSAKVAGIGFAGLCVKLIELTYDKAQNKLSD
jgi:D-alanine-D-alanine ligase